MSLLEFITLDDHEIDLDDYENDDLPALYEDEMDDALDNDDWPLCPVCGDPIDYCIGHGELG